MPCSVQRVTGVKDIGVVACQDIVAGAFIAEYKGAASRLHPFCIDLPGIAMIFGCQFSAVLYH
jgi:hypothetical protein